MLNAWNILKIEGLRWWRRKILQERFEWECEWMNVSVDGWMRILPISKSRYVILKTSLVIWKENKCHGVSETNSGLCCHLRWTHVVICHEQYRMLLQSSIMLSSKMNLCGHLSWAISHVVAIIYHIDWTVSHVAVPAEGMKDVKRNCSAK